MDAIENKTEDQADSLLAASAAAPEYSWERNPRNGARCFTASGAALNFIQYDDGNWYWGGIARHDRMDLNNCSGIVDTRDEAIEELVAWAKVELRCAAGR